MAKLLLAMLVAYAGWWLWRGPRRPRGNEAPQWRNPSELEALSILGLKPDADEADIRAAHRRLVAAVHPDRGGSADLTRRINAARDALLRPATRATDCTADSSGNAHP